MNPNPLPKTNASLNVLEVPEINASQEVSPHSIDLDVTVGKVLLPVVKTKQQRWWHRIPGRIKSLIEFL